MPDEIDRTIYKLEIDGSDYIAGVDKLSASTNKLSTAQEQANKTLQDNQKALQSQSEYLQQTKKDLDAYSGTSEKYRQQLNKTYQTALTNNQKLTDIVNQNQAAFDKANASALNFAETAAKATNLQQATTGGKIQTSVPANISAQLAGAINIPAFTETAQNIANTKKEFDDLATSVQLAEARMRQLNATDEEFKTLAPIVASGKQALHDYAVLTGDAADKTVHLRTEIFNALFDAYYITLLKNESN